MGAIEKRGTPLFYRSRGIRLATPPAQIREVAPARMPAGRRRQNAGTVGFPWPICPAHESAGCTVKTHEGRGTQEVYL